MRAVSTPEEAAKGAAIVALTTNALDPFFPSSWISDGMHITTVRPSEMMLDALMRCESAVNIVSRVARSSRRFIFTQQIRQQ